MFGRKPEERLEVKDVELAQQESREQRDDGNVVAQALRALPLEARPLGGAAMIRSQSAINVAHTSA